MLTDNLFGPPHASLQSVMMGQCLYSGFVQLWNARSISTASHVAVVFLTQDGTVDELIPAEALDCMWGLGQARMQHMANSYQQIPCRPE